MVKVQSSCHKSLRKCHKEKKKFLKHIQCIVRVQVLKKTKTNPVLSVAQSYADESLISKGCRLNILSLAQCKAETKLLVIFLLNSKTEPHISSKEKMCKTKSQMRQEDLVFALTAAAES